jgi:sarcosine oxidase subunit gamma
MADTAVRRMPAALIDVSARASVTAAASAQPSHWMRVQPPAARFIFQGRAGALAAAAAAWGVGFSDEPCRAIVKGERASLWLGPDEFLVLDAAVAGSAVAAGMPGATEAEAAIEASLGQALTGIPYSLVNVSHRQFALELRGRHAATILNGACPLDLDLAEFPVGMCTRTVFAKADIVLWRTESEIFHVEVWRSFAAYVTGLLDEIARDFDTQI